SGSANSPIWQVNKDTGPGTVENPGGPVAFSPDARRCAWSYGTSKFNGRPVSFDVFLFDLENRRELHPLKRHTHCVTSRAVSPDGQRSRRRRSGSILCPSDVEEGNSLRLRDGNHATLVVTTSSPDGNRAASVSRRVWAEEESQEYTMLLWDVASHRELHRFGG